MISYPNRKFAVLFIGLFLLQVFLVAQETVTVERTNNKVILEGSVYYIHTVKPGETLYAISRAYNITQKAIAIENPGVIAGIQIGQALKIPVDAEPLEEIDTSELVESGAQGKTHTVRPGETLYGIARLYDLKEEDLRQHFLVQLNGAYEGEATGETFNYEGKTDILIRHKGKNVFIAECKFWKGSKGLTDTIDQLLGYTSWRDTKTAIIVFSRGKNFTEVLEKIPDAVESHPCFKKEIERSDETNFRYTFQHRDDPERELILTVMVFNIPGE